jgi:hypothetical protein
MSDRFDGPVVNLLVCFFPFARKAAGAAKHPAFPAPSLFFEGKRFARLGQFVPRERGGVSFVIARSVSDEAIHHLSLAEAWIASLRSSQ